MKTNYSFDTLIILLISGTISACLIPFCILRLMQQDYPIALLNITATLVTLTVFVQVFLTKKTSFARWMLSVLSAMTLLGTIYLKGADQLFWAYPTLATIFYMLSAHIAALVAGIILAVVIVFVYSVLAPIHLSTAIATLILTYAFAYAFSVKMQRKNHQLRNSAFTDSLTSLGNRRALDERLQVIEETRKKQPIEYCLLVIDIDFFKSINDEFGHVTGDQVLSAFANVLKLGIRGKDEAFRYGGEEFVIILEKTELLNGVTISQNLLKDIEASNWPHINDKVITASGGIAQLNESETIAQWIARADKALYQAKDCGRNNVIAAQCNFKIQNPFKIVSS
ncbi:GGDEF domain-containing protein [Glaciecola sp. KUL10]|uniref:GGDEF domain-containing protein n=1 Tax=Glaciecola sp. (strain KUL10) TaxID=2161813 RepID=UPI000D78607C|nr:GGDEF domain-containing protein [Glaciecola sp. KUL10]